MRRRRRKIHNKNGRGGKQTAASVFSALSLRKQKTPVDQTEQASSEAQSSSIQKKHLPSAAAASDRGKQEAGSSCLSKNNRLSCWGLVHTLSEQLLPVLPSSASGLEVLPPPPLSDGQHHYKWINVGFKPRATVRDPSHNVQK